LGQPNRQGAVERTLSTDIPGILDYLESQRRKRLPVRRRLDRDISISVFFRNAAFARSELDAARWPQTAGWRAHRSRFRPFAALSLSRTS